MSSSGLTRAGQFLGTPDYAAPEQISGRDVDGRADQYALACVAYTLLSGSVLFRRDVPMAVLYAHLSVPPPRLTAVRPELPDTVNQVLARALAKEPDDRYDSCGTFADALREALGLEPYDPSRPAGTSATPPSRSAATAPLTIPPDSPPTKLLPGSPSPSPWLARRWRACRRRRREGQARRPGRPRREPGPRWWPRTAPTTRACRR